MAHIDPRLERNRHFATTDAREGTSILAKYPVYVITCLDPRTDPSAFLELEVGDAMVIRNAGGSDVELLRSSPVLPSTTTVSGHVYDGTTGLITTILPAAPMDTSEGR